MALKAIYKDKNDIPAGLEEHYVERGGQWELQAEGMKTQGDVDRVIEAQRKERDARIEAEGKLKAYQGLDPDQVRKDADELAVLRAEKEAGGFKGLEDPKVQQFIDQKVAQKTAPLERELGELRSKNEELTGKAEASDGKYRRMLVENTVRAAAEKAGVEGTAIDDAIMYGHAHFEIVEDPTKPEGQRESVMTKGGLNGISPGLDAATWLSDRKQDKPHWWGTATGGGSKGNDGAGSGANPWKAEKFSLQAATKYAQEHGEAKAIETARAAGKTIAGQPLPVE